MAQTRSRRSEPVLPSREIADRIRRGILSQGSPAPLMLARFRAQPTQKLSRQQLKGTREARTDTDRAEVPSISRQNPVDLPAFSDGGHGPVNKAQSESFELGVEFQRSRNIGWERQLVFIPRRRIEDFGHQPAHRFAICSKEVVHFRKNESGNDHGCHRHVFRKARLATWRPRQRPEETTGVGDNWRDQSSISRKSSDSSPSFMFVDSNRRVEGGRRPE